MILKLFWLLSSSSHATLSSYSHFSEDGCKLFRIQDYTPAKETHDVRFPKNERAIEDALMSDCPRCQRVSLLGLSLRPHALILQQMKGNIRGLGHIIRSSIPHYACGYFLSESRDIQKAILGDIGRIFYYFFRRRPKPAITTGLCAVAASSSTVTGVWSRAMGPGTSLSIAVTSSRLFSRTCSTSRE